ncbi:MAG: LytTR family transcriptional regulator [Hyphomonadaceae bacterium]|nr:LytTR family transcriptional regulator [Hyphomonadaceae bacterium]
MALAVEQSNGATARDDYNVWYAGAATALFLAYLVIFLTTAGPDLWRATTAAAANVAPAALLGLCVRPSLHAIVRLDLMQRLGAFVAGAIGFAIVWYGAIAITLGAANVLQGRPFDLVWLLGPALVWQIYQGLIVFVLIVSATALHEAERKAIASSVPSGAPQAGETGALLVNTDEGLAPIAVREILAIEADDDQSLVHLKTRVLRVRRSLANWDQLLSAEQFVRVHRSWIINLEATVTIEPVGGGRMNAHLPGGLTAPVSRSGAQALRARSS